MPISCSTFGRVRVLWAGVSSPDVACTTAERQLAVSLSERHRQPQLLRNPAWFRILAAVTVARRCKIRRNCSPTTDSLSSPSHRPDQSYNPKPPVSDPSWTVETAAAPSFAYLADRDVFILGRRPTNKLESDVSLAAHPSQSLLMFELSGASSWPPGRQNKRWSRCRDSLRNLAIRSKGPSSSDLGAAIHLSTTRNRRWNSFSSAAGCQRSSIRIL